MSTDRKPAIVWDDSEDSSSSVGYGTEDRSYSVTLTGDRWRWTRWATPSCEAYQAGAFLTMDEAKRHAEDNEQEALMGKGKKDKKADKGANGSAASHKGEAELRGHERPGGVVRASFVESLPCKMDAAEVEALEHKLTTVTREKVRKEGEKVALSEEIKGLKKREDSLVAQLEDEAELRDIACEEIFYVETGAVDTVRTDSGEVIRTRSATDDDRQEDMTRTLAQNAELVGPVGDGTGDIDDPQGVLGGNDGDPDGFQPGAEG